MFQILDAQHHFKDNIEDGIAVTVHVTALLATKDQPSQLGTDTVRRILQRSDLYLFNISLSLFGLEAD